MALIWVHITKRATWNFWFKKECN